MTQTASRTLQDRAIFGFFLMTTGLVLYTLSDAFIKHLMSLYSVKQTLFLRSTTRLIPLLIAMYYQGGIKKILGTAHPGRHIVRLGVNMAYTCAFMLAMSMGSLTMIYTLSYTSPFFMVILSALLLKEKVTKERWLAIVIGMVGVLLAIRPGSSVFEIAALLVLAGAFLGSLNKILMRRLAETEHSLSIAIYPNLTMILITLPLLATAWQAMPWSHWGLFAFVGCITALGQYLIVQALRFTQASVLAPIDYSTFFWVVALDFFWWNKWPDLYTVLGALIIVSSNLYILYFTKRDKS
ncbi:MAG: DMT family transporter [Methylococcales bacterium]|nr:DMT family transporter [Methylococcales bacterium]